MCGFIIFAKRVLSIWGKRFFLQRLISCLNNSHLTSRSCFRDITYSLSVISGYFISCGLFLPHEPTASQRNLLHNLYYSFPHLELCPSEHEKFLSVPTKYPVTTKANVFIHTVFSYIIFRYFYYQTINMFDFPYQINNFNKIHRICIFFLLTFRTSLNLSILFYHVLC